MNRKVTDAVCLAWFKFEGYTGVTAIAGVELILGFRVLALWNRKKIIVAIVAFALLAEVATMLSILSSTYVNMGATSHVIPGVEYRACIPLRITPYFFAFWLPPLGYETVVFILAASKGYMTIRNAFSTFTFKTTGARLLEIMMRDSLWYFLLIVICDMVCSLIWLKGPDSLLQAVVGFGLGLPSIAASHMLLNLREAYYHPSGATTAGASRTYDLPTFNRGNEFFASGGRHRAPKGTGTDTEWALDPTQDGLTVLSKADIESNIARVHSDPDNSPNDTEANGKPQHNVGTVTSSTGHAPPEGDEATDEVYELDHIPSRLHTRVQRLQSSPGQSQ